MNARTLVQKFALIFGIVYALVGLLGFVPGLVQPPAPGNPPLAFDAGYGLLLGLFPINLLHNLVHVVVGVAGVMSASRFASARAYSRALAIVFGLLTIMGLVPGLDTTAGLIPLFGADVLLHALTALAGAYFGWFARPEPAATSGTTTRAA